MIQLFGEISLYFALCFAAMQSILPLLGYWRNNSYFLAFARPCALGQFVFIAIAYALITIAFGVSDFSIAYVAANSHPLLPLMYRLTAVWGAHEGSILLWILLLNCWTIAFLFCRPTTPHLCRPAACPRDLETSRYALDPADKPRDDRNEQSRDDSGELTRDGITNKQLTLAILGCISLCFICFLLFTSNPFLPAPEILMGRDLNPLLQDPGFVIHPPMLYVGYVGFSVAFAITLAALICKKCDTVWARITRHFALAAWCFLTFGITLGSWWAYRVLGWGGFWFWDPVENASLLPWLSGTALIHVLILCEKRNAAQSWAAILAIITFALSLFGTFLVRSGVLVSVHTFATDPARGIFLLLLLGILITAALSVYVIRLPTLANTPSPFSWVSREMALRLNSALLFVAMITILLGTLYPLILDALHLGAISVGAPYFNKVMMPMVLLMMVLMGISAYTHWFPQTFTQLLQQVWLKFFISIASACAFIWGMTNQFHFTAIITLSLSIWIALSVKSTWRSFPGMALAHIGFAILVIGIMLSSILTQEREVRMKPGNETTLGPYQFQFVKTIGVNGSNFRGIQAEFDVSKNHRNITTMHPEKRIYTVRDMVMTKVAIHPSIARDLYLALGEPLDDDYWSVRIYYKPFIRWIWFGGLVMIIGGLLAIFHRKKYFSRGNPS